MRKTTTKQPAAKKATALIVGAASPKCAPSIRLLDKAEILAITGVTFPTVWTWMRAGKFPRSRVAGGKSIWRSDEVEAWLDTLPVRKLKGDALEALTNEKPAGVELSGSCLRGSASS